MSWGSCQPRRGEVEIRREKILWKRVRREKEEEELKLQARERAFDAGLIGPGGVVAPQARDVFLYDHPEAVHGGSG